MKNEKILGLIFAVTGVILLTADIFVYRNTADFLKNAGRSEGVVIGLAPSSRSRGGGSTMYAPIIKFTIPNGSDFEFTSSLSSYPPAYSPGDSVEVLYDPQNPAKAEVNGFFSIWLAVFVLSLLGAVFSAIGVTVLRFAR